MITIENAVFDIQFKNFFILWKSHVPFLGITNLVRSQSFPKKTNISYIRGQ